MPITLNPVRLRRIDVDATSSSRIDVDTTSFVRPVPAGKISQLLLFCVFIASN